MNDNSDDFREAGVAFARAYDRLREGCAIPCSFEVFKEELKEMRKRRDATPETCANVLVVSYQQLNL